MDNLIDYAKKAAETANSLKATMEVMNKKLLEEVNKMSVKDKKQFEKEALEMLDELETPDVKTDFANFIKKNM